MIEEFKDSRIPSLDGLRAISIFLVLLGHVFYTQDYFLNSNWHLYLGDLSNLGVRFFFIISGFLISTLLYREWENSHSISLGKFYIRRSLRIFPAFYFYIFVMFGLTLLGLVEINYNLFWRASTYTINYLPSGERGWFLGHLWSLAVEEQFYLLWPLVILMLGKKKSIIFLISVILLIPVVRLCTILYLPEMRSLMRWSFHTVCDSLAIGCLLAAIRVKLHQINLYKSLINSVWPILIFFIVIFINYYFSDRPRINHFVMQSVMNFGLALFLDFAISSANSRTATFLNWRPMKFIGVLSYSIYLWQQFFLAKDSPINVQSFLLNILFIFIAALFSYYLIERKFLIIKDRFSTKY